MSRTKIMVTTDMASFSKTLHDELESYFEDVTDGSIQAIENVAFRCMRNLQETSPVGKGTPKSGAYKNGWYIRPMYKNRTHALVEIANKEYRLTHLLEHGHNLAREDYSGNKFVYGFSPAKPHIYQAEHTAITELLDEIREVAKGK